ncbi:hypothetical protein DVDV_0806 [Desulfovibrio sp. DV]|nr:hypothetical protein DVDV_0806 [Desulfovibrio sp. DV]
MPFDSGHGQAITSTLGYKAVLKVGQCDKNMKDQGTGC